VLGPVQVRDGEAENLIGGRQARHLVARLALDAPRSYVGGRGNGAMGERFGNDFDGHPTAETGNKRCSKYVE
jgi:hypothetical protein